MSKRLVIFGGTGECGKGLVKRAVELPFDKITAVVRDVDKARKTIPKEVHLVQGDVYDKDAASKIADIVNDADFVCSAMASSHSPYTQMSTLTSYIIEAAKKRPSDAPNELRYICYGLCGLRSDSKTFLQNMAGIVSPLKVKPGLKDHQLQMIMLENQSNVLEYSVFGTCVMVDKPPHAYKGGSPEDLDNKASLTNRISIYDAADLCLRRLLDTETPLPPILDIIYV